MILDDDKDIQCQFEIIHLSELVQKFLLRNFDSMELLSDLVFDLIPRKVSVYECGTMYIRPRIITLEDLNDSYTEFKLRCKNRFKIRKYTSYEFPDITKNHYFVTSQ